MLKKIASKFFEFANKLTNFIPIQSSPSLSKYIMSKDEAMRILNIKNDSELKLQKIIEQTEKYIKMNDPKKGGSFYIQNKVYYAKLALIPLCKETINNKMNGINDTIKKEKIANLCIEKRIISSIEIFIINQIKLFILYLYPNSSAINI